MGGEGQGGEGEGGGEWGGGKREQGFTCIRRTGVHDSALGEKPGGESQAETINKSWPLSFILMGQYNKFA